MEERIQKILARAGYGSRRSCEDLITAGRIKINGVTAILGAKADPAVDKVQIDGRTIPAESSPNIYIALNKPRGVLSDEDPQDSRPTVRDLVAVPGHLFTVGRLDLESEGLILLTNDGELANRLTHPRYGHEKEYKVLVSSRPDDKQLEAWRRGVVMEDGYRTAPADVFVDSLSGKGTWMRIILREGKKRQIREVGKILGLHVVKIFRIRIGGLHLGNLKPREWRYLSAEEVEGLTKTARKLPRFQPRVKTNSRPRQFRGGTAENGTDKRKDGAGLTPRSSSSGKAMPGAKSSQEPADTKGRQNRRQGSAGRKPFSTKKDR